MNLQKGTRVEILWHDDLVGMRGTLMSDVVTEPSIPPTRGFVIGYHVHLDGEEDGTTRFFKRHEVSAISPLIELAEAAE